MHQKGLRGREKKTKIHALEDETWNRQRQLLGGGPPHRRPRRWRSTWAAPSSHSSPPRRDQIGRGQKAQDLSPGIRGRAEKRARERWTSRSAAGGRENEIEDGMDRLEILEEDEKRRTGIEAGIGAHGNEINSLERRSRYLSLSLCSTRSLESSAEGRWGRNQGNGPPNYNSTTLSLFPLFFCFLFFFVGSRPAGDWWLVLWVWTGP